MAEAFFDAIRKGEMSGLIALLKNNVIFYSDSDGKAAAAREVLEGNETVAAFLMKVLHPVFGNTAEYSIDVKCIWFNGLPGFVIRDNGKPVSAFSFMLEDDAISNVYVHRNPGKLSFFARPEPTNKYHPQATHLRFI